MGDFNFFVSTNLKYGAGQSEKIAEHIKDLGCQKVAVIIDKGVVNNTQIKKALDALKMSGRAPVDIYVNESVEPTYDYLEEFRKQFLGKGYDCMLGIGGGSALDLTKGIATLVTNEGTALSFRGFPKLKNRPLPVIAIPTTAGTGSEVTYNAVFTDSKEKKKLGINSTLNFPVLAIIDPLIYVGTPEKVAVSSGCDALVHTLESYVHKNHTPVSRMFSKEAFRLLFNNLRVMLEKPQDLDVWGALALGAYLAGIALINAGSGPSGAFSYPLGAVYKVPHGYAGAVFIASITRTNVEKGYLDYADLYDLIEGSDKKLSVKEKNQKFSEEMQKLMDKLKVPRNLRDFGLKEEDIEFMVSQHDVLKGAIAQNPIEITKEDTKKIFNALFR